MKSVVILPWVLDGDTNGASIGAQVCQSNPLYFEHLLPLYEAGRHRKFSLLRIIGTTVFFGEIDPC